MRDDSAISTGVALYAHVSSADQRADLEQQFQCLRVYAAAKGYTIIKEVVQIASGVNDQRPKLLKLLTNQDVGVIVVEYRDRRTRFEFAYISAGNARSAG